MTVCPCGKEFKKRHSKQIHCHRECQNPLNHQWHGSDVYADAKYKAKYGISLEEYNGMFADQNGCCKICKTHQVEFKRKLHVDHCHKTGKVRGLLCHNCNLAIGCLKEDPAIIAAALEYVS